MSFDVAAIRAQFPILDARPHGRALHYLDSAATAQVPRAVLDAMESHETQSRANVARSVHHLAEAATEAYEGARAIAARFLGAAEPAEIVFTSGTTAAINLVAHAYGELLAPGDRVVLSLAEHHSNIVPWQLLQARRGIDIAFLPVTDEGRIDLGKLEETVTPRCKLVAITHCSNVTGAITPVAPLVEAARAVGARVLLDGAQMAPRGALDVAALEVDFYALSGHKAYGPSGIGVLWGRAEVLEDLPPFMGGGGMIRRVSTEGSQWAPPPRRFEAGTPPITQAVGLGAAMTWLTAIDHAGALAHSRRLTGRILSGLDSIPGVSVIGPPGLEERIGVVSFVIEGAHSHDVCQILDTHGVATRGGHHCAQPLMDTFGIAGTARASLGVYNDGGDVDALLGGVEDAVARLT